MKERPLQNVGLDVASASLPGEGANQFAGGTCDSPEGKRPFAALLFHQPWATKGTASPSRNTSTSIEPMALNVLFAARAVLYAK